MLNINEGVYVVFQTDYVDRGYITRLHDDFVEIFSLLNNHKCWYKRERVVSTKKLNRV